MALLTLAHVAARQESPDTREALAAYLNQRITVQAVFQRFGFTTEGRRVACFEQVEIEGAVVAQHVWIPFGSPLKRLHLKRGCRVEFEARVHKYVKNDFATFHYGLDDIQSPKLLSRKCKS